jgi:hypothetical protein
LGIQEVTPIMTFSSYFQNSFYTAGKNYLLRMCNGEDKVTVSLFVVVPLICADIPS